jgi:hypothetical protein
MLAQRLMSLQGAMQARQPARITIPFGEWRPDLPALANPGVVKARNVIPGEQSYGPFPGLAVQSDALTAYCRGALAAKASDGNSYFYCGDATKLYQIFNQTVTDKSKGGGYSNAATQGWEATVFGTSILFTNFDDAVQSLTIGGAGNYADHITSTLKPKARHIATVRNFVVLGNTNDATDGDVPHRIWWSAINDSLDFDPDASTQCDFNDMPDGGFVTKIIGGADYGVIFQEGQISRMTYTGDNLIFQIDPVDRRRGSPIPGSIIGRGRLIFYISEEGLFAFDGTQSIPLGVNRFDKWFWDQFDIGNAHRVSSAIDYPNKLVCWAFPGEGASGANPNKLLVYDWQNRRATYCDLETEFIVAATTQAFSLDDLDDIGTDIDDETVFSVSFDDPQWRGGLYRFAAFDMMHRLSYFTGDNLAAEIESNETQLYKGQRAFVSNTRPLVDGGAPTVAVGTRNRNIDSESFGSDVAINDEGECPQESDARYHRFLFKQPAGETWTHVQGVEITVSPSGFY